MTSCAGCASERRATTETCEPLPASGKASFLTRVSAGKQFSTSIRVLPADAFILALLLLRAELWTDVGQINHVGTIAKALDRFLELGRTLGDDDDLGAVERVLDRLLHQAGDVRNRVLDVGLVRPVNACERDLAVVDRHAVALADHRFDQFGRRALAQVVGARFEAEPEHGPLLLPRLLPEPVRLIDLVAVA